MMYNSRNMPKVSSVFTCQQCGFQSSQFYGKCPECGTWGSLVEQVTAQSSSTSLRQSKKHSPGQVIALKDVLQTNDHRLTTHIGEFDRVLGGGVVAGSIVLISGEPGIGKSTLLTQLAINLSSPQTAHSSQGVLYVAGEESDRQIKIRADRIKPNADFKILNEVDVDTITATIEQIKPSLVIVDSIQTIQTQDLNSAPGSIGQVRETAHRLQLTAKRNHIPIFLVGHITKEGSIAGPKTLEHLVDAVLTLEGDPLSNFRILRTNKNRFGATDEVGIFEMEEYGLKEVTNPSGIFIEDKIDSPGSVVISTMNGQRPLLIEIQALVTKSYLPVPRRVGTGVDNNRLQLLVAVLAKRLNLPLFDQDIFVNVTGGLKVSEPAADLGIAMAIISSLKDKTVPAKTVFIGEVGLLGEIRPVRGLDKRSNEAKKLGYTHIISPSSARTLTQAAQLVFK